MLYVSIDIETLGLNPETCDVIEFGAIVDDMKSPISELPRYHVYLTKPKDLYCGEPFAMSMHPKILRRIADRTPGYNYIPHDMLGSNFSEWLEQYPVPDKLTVAGKNFMSFDMRFLRRLPYFETWVKISHRHIDPCMLYALPDDIELPNTKTCLERAGINKEVEHTAVEDALDVVRLIRNKWM